MSLRIAMAAVEAGIGVCRRRAITTTSSSAGLAAAMSRSRMGCSSRSISCSARTGRFRAKAQAFLDDLRSHYWLDGGKLAVAHAGLKEDMIGRGSPAVRDFALFGETTGEIDEFGLPVRADWAAHYRGQTAVVYGHTPMLRSRVGEQHDLHRHGLRVRRQADGAALAGTRARERSGRATWFEPVRPLARRDRGRLSPEPRPMRLARLCGRFGPTLDRYGAHEARSSSPRRTPRRLWR